MHINLELNEEYESKLVYVQQKTNQQDVDAVIKAAIDAYYQQLEPRPKKAFQPFKDSGFIGCVQSEEDRSENYKSVVTSAIQKRFERSHHASDGQL